MHFNARKVLLIGDAPTIHISLGGFLSVYFILLEWSGKALFIKCGIGALDVLINDCLDYIPLEVLCVMSHK